MGGKDSLEERGGELFTDLSKFVRRLDGGVYFRELSMSYSFRLRDHCCVFQAVVIDLLIFTDELSLGIISFL